ncbi:MAG: rRNA maturation RNase YbeY [Chitinophagales bacterium]
MPAPQISFHYLTPVNSLRDRARLKKFLGRLLLSEGKAGGKVAYVFCKDGFLLNINKEFLQHHDLTDIISFNLSPAGQPLEGEIYISVERVRENAMRFETSFLNELHRVIFHGTLHFCGYADKTAQQRKVMRLQEDLNLGRYFK